MNALVVLKKNEWKVNLVMYCVCMQHYSLELKAANLPWMRTFYLE